MKAATIKEIKTELENLSTAELLPLALRLARFKKENKELLTYLLFEAGHEQDYIHGVKNDIDLLFEDLNTNSVYIAKKNLRKIIRVASRFIKYSDEAQTEIDILMHICDKINDSGLKIAKSTVLTNMYKALLKKINASIATLHEDLQYDYLKQVQQLTLQQPAIA